jgi:hypothetical protein
MCRVGLEALYLIKMEMMRFGAQDYGIMRIRAKDYGIMKVP